MKKRIDILIFEKGLVESRKKATDLVKEGKVFVAGKKIEKPSAEVDMSSEIEITEVPKYVSRAGLKLEKAVVEFGVDVKNKTVLDVGSSTGGFTDFLLQNGAKKVFCVDVGTSQLHPKIREDKRVAVMEKTDIRNVENLPEEIDLVVIDVSFISLTKILEKVFSLVKKDGRVVVLVKPQFEVGKEKIGRGGVVKEEDGIVALENIKKFAESVGFKILGQIVSPIKGGDGNVEYLLCLSL